MHSHRGSAEAMSCLWEYCDPNSVVALTCQAHRHEHLMLGQVHMNSDIDATCSDVEQSQAEEG